MRDKNIKRAAKALFLAQGDDKNKLVSSRITDKEVRTLIQDQGRALVILDRLLFPTGKWDFAEDEVYSVIRNKLEKRGHRIQDDNEEDSPEYAEEKRKAREARLSRVPSVLGMSLEEIGGEEVDIKAIVGDKNLSFEEKLARLKEEKDEKSSTSFVPVDLEERLEAAFMRGIEFGLTLKL